MNNDFLEEEIRCDFKVDKSRKLLWKIELDMMERFVEVCKKYNLQYFLLGGSAIGAVRHQGFIPWDDDIDIGMKRKDFDIFMKKCIDEFKEPYFVQYVEGNQHFDGILRIRNSDTTGILYCDWDKQCNSGIFIEIYPLDNVPDSKLLRWVQNTKVRFYYGAIIRRIYQFEDSFLKHAIYRLCKRISLENLLKRYEKACRKYEHAKTKCCNTVTTPEAARKEHNLIRNEDIQEMVEVPYEYMMLSVPNGNERVLTQHYGDYMTLPQIEERGNYHNETVYYDPYKSYKDLVGSKEVKEYFHIKQ